MERKISRVIVLGAGASCSYIESPTGYRPPLAREILSTYHKLAISENRYVLVGHLINYVRNTRGVPPEEFASWDEDLETFFSEIDEEVTEFTERIKSGEKLDGKEFVNYSITTGAYNQLIPLFASIFNEIQNGPISIPYMMLANELSEEDVIITFNWDTLLDRALYSSGSWSPSNGYCIKPEAIFDEHWRSPDVYDRNNLAPIYIKLHGSTNWLAPYHGAHLSSGEMYSVSKYGMDKLFVYLNSDSAYDTYKNRYWGPYEPFSYCYYPPNLPIVRDDREPGKSIISMVSAIDLPEHGETVINDPNVYSMPLIVPPVRNKQYQRYGKIFSILWGLATDSIELCRLLYIIGYSFPETDIATQRMFSEALKRNKVLEKIIIINPHPENIFELFTSGFGIEKSKIELRKQKFEVSHVHQGALL